MTEVRFIQKLLETQWEETVTGRSNDVPEPTFVREKDQSMARLNKQDVGYVTSAEDTVKALMGFGMTHQSADTAVKVEYRAATRSSSVGLDDGYDRLFGKRTGANELGEPDRWSGILGETERILRADRDGRAEWDVIGEELRFRDFPEVGGKKYWRADVIIPLLDPIQKIDTSI